MDFLEKKMNGIWNMFGVVVDCTFYSLGSIFYYKYFLYLFGRNYILTLIFWKIKMRQSFTVMFYYLLELQTVPNPMIAKNILDLDSETIYFLILPTMWHFGEFFAAELREVTLKENLAWFRFLSIRILHTDLTIIQDNSKHIQNGCNFTFSPKSCI